MPTLHFFLFCTAQHPIGQIQKFATQAGRNKGKIRLQLYKNAQWLCSSKSKEHGLGFFLELKRRMPEREVISSSLDYELHYAGMGCFSGAGRGRVKQ